MQIAKGVTSFMTSVGIVDCSRSSSTIGMACWSGNDVILEIGNVVDTIELKC
jgi:hypothetical protein